MCPERSVIMSLICISWETVEKLEWAALLWILVLAKARSAVPISAAISAKPSNAGQRQNQRNPGGREAEGQLAASLARYSPLRGCASLAPCHPPFCLYARPIPFFKSLLSCLRRCDWFGDDSARAEALNFVSLESEFLENSVFVFAK